METTIPASDGLFRQAGLAAHNTIPFQYNENLLSSLSLLLKFDQLRMTSVRCQTMMRFVLPWAAVIVLAGKALTTRDDLSGR
jgi:hypothetical protein